ncbi:MAG: hypothetical protein J6K74_01005 [Marinifilaceae bacterium]|nr:hypothetical protein [Marinifilaceae bacterium]
MNNIFKITLLLCAIAGATHTTWGQQRMRGKELRVNSDIPVTTVIDSTPFNQRLIDEMFDYMYSTREEKLYLHTDKECCQPTDTIWFRGYLISAATNKLADYSRYIYVELIDKNNRVYWREKVARNEADSTFSGYFPIQDNITQGEYFLRAYTYWQQNQNDRNIYRKRIRIINPFDHKVNCKMIVDSSGSGKRTLKVSFHNYLDEKYDNVPFHYIIPGETPQNTLMESSTGINGIAKIEIKDPESDHIWIKFTDQARWDFETYSRIPGSKLAYDLQLFPEGGYLIPNTIQKIGFKSVGRDGLGIPIKGHIEDREGKVITSIESNHLGMGHFIINTTDCDGYKIVVTNSEGNSKTISLPKTNSKAFAIALTNNDANITYNILGSGDCSKMSLYIHNRGIPLGVINAKDNIGRTLELGLAPEGVIHFVLIDTLGKIQSERVWFNRRKERNTIEIETPETQITPRAEATITLNLKSPTMERIRGNFSISVINNGQGAVDMFSGGIESYTLMTSDLTGYIEQAGYYFEKYDQEHIDALDNLMLTQGWSRFDIEEILAHKTLPEPKYFVERGQYLSGYVKNFLGKNSKEATIRIFGSNGVMATTTTNQEGRFVNEDIWFDEGTRFTVQAISAKGKKSIELLLDEQQFETPTFVMPAMLAKLYKDEEFYNRYGKDYIFADNGERLSTFGIVNVSGETVKATSYQSAGALRARREEEKKYQDDERKLFMQGLTDIKSFGNVRSTAAEIYIAGEDAKTYTPPKMTYDRNKSKIQKSEAPATIQTTFAGYNDRTYRSALNNMPRVITSEGTYSGTPGMAHSIESVGFAGVSISERVEIDFNIQTIVPLAPQKSDKHFYKPNYIVYPVLLREVEDEKITRYWNPAVKIDSETPFTFGFPTAAGDGNQSYTITVEGIDTEGNAITEQLIYRL